MHIDLAISWPTVGVKSQATFCRQLYVLEAFLFTLLSRLTVLSDFLKTLDKSLAPTSCPSWKISGKSARKHLINSSHFLSYPQTLVCSILPMPADLGPHWNLCQRPIYGQNPMKLRKINGRWFQNIFPNFYKVWVEIPVSGSLKLRLIFFGRGRGQVKNG